MSVMSTPARVLSTSDARWPDDPMPGKAMFSVPGSALARAINSRMVLALMPGRASKMDGALATQAIGEKSLIGSNGSLGYSVALIAWLV